MTAEAKIVHPISLVHPRETPDARALGMAAAIGGFPASDKPLFMAGYSELCRIDLSGKRTLEICGGAGKLAGCLAEVFPAGEVIGLDLYKADGPEVEERTRRLPGLSYTAGNAFDLSRYPDGHFDLVFGQAALHHLAHDTSGLCREVCRVLKPGGGWYSFSSRWGTICWLQRFGPLGWRSMNWKMKATCFVRNSSG